jgi:hypothetical protein
MEIPSLDWSPLEKLNLPISFNYAQLIILKSILPYLLDSNNITIAFTIYPSICIEKTFGKYKISILYLDTHPVYLNNIDKLYNSLYKHFSKEKYIITRIEMNDSLTRSVMYGPLYEYEKRCNLKHSKTIFGTDCTTIYWEKCIPVCDLNPLPYLKL